MCSPALLHLALLARRKKRWQPEFIRIYKREGAYERDVSKKNEFKSSLLSRMKRKQRVDIIQQQSMLKGHITTFTKEMLPYEDDIDARDEVFSSQHEPS